MAEREADLRAQVGVLIDSIAARESCDVMRDLAIPFPSQVFLTLFGLPLQDRDRLLAWNDALLELTNPGHADPDPRSFELGLELFNYLSTNITERREGSSDRADLLTQLVHDGTLTDEEVLGMCFIIVVAGLDTVTSAIGFSLARLASDSKMRQRICADPSVIPAFIEEILRVDAPIPFVARLTNEDVEVAGTTVPKDTIVLLSVGSAGRDPRRFSDAEQIRLNEREAHFAFGRGPHRCLGSHLARMELRLVLEEWHARIPEYSLASSVEPEIIWPRGILAYSELPLALGTA
jgi:cytochrome P450